MKNLLNIAAILISLKADAQTFSALTIADSLKKDANVVEQYSERIYEIKSPGKAILQERHVYTILNESGNRYGNYRSYYDKFVKIENISGKLYDATGKEVRHAKKKDMQDVSGTDDESLITDLRYVVNDFYCRTYPYTVDYQEEDEINGILEIADWVPESAANLSVVHNKYVIIAPKDYVLRYRSYNCSIQPTITESSNKRIYTWELKNVPARVSEAFTGSWSQDVPYVQVAPSQFEVEGYKGNMSTWEEYGKFYDELLKGRDVLPENIKKRVHELTDGLADPKQKISALYDFLQKNTHYISIQLGIGGWQPFDATYVATKRYGDCKALSNYMVALLKEAGIKGNSVIITAGRHAGEVNRDFPSDQFNHVICCVPLQKDTVWLECTSQSLPAGYLSGFTADRYGLLVGDHMGKLVRTPKYGLNDNLQIRKISGVIDESGNLTTSVNSTYKCMMQDELDGVINYLSRERQLDYLKENINLPTYDISKFEFKQDKSVLPPSVYESLEIKANNYAQVSGKRLFVNPDIMTRSIQRLSRDEDRKFEIRLKDEEKEVDSVEIQIPKGYEPEAVPEDLKIVTKFGKFTSSVKVMPDRIFYYRLRERYSGTFPATEYNSLVNYCEQLYKADRRNIVLIKK